jgi:hypothetical protein
VVRLNTVNPPCGADKVGVVAGGGNDKGWGGRGSVSFGDWLSVGF